MSDEFKENVPPINAIPTTAGTGSEAGKSAVIVNPEGQKKVYGNPIFMPRTVALVPQLTEQVDNMAVGFLIPLASSPPHSCHRN